MAKAKPTARAFKGITVGPEEAKVIGLYLIEHLTRCLTALHGVTIVKNSAAKSWSAPQEAYWRSAAQYLKLMLVELPRRKEVKRGDRVSRQDRSSRPT